MNHCPHCGAVHNEEHELCIDCQDALRHSKRHILIMSMLDIPEDMLEEAAVLGTD